MSHASDAEPLNEPTALSGSLALLDMPLHRDGYVVGVTAEPAAGADLAVRLGELGFLPGEAIRVIAKASLGGPLAVRVAGGTFALRRSEAASVRVMMGQRVLTSAAEG